MLGETHHYNFLSLFLSFYAMCTVWWLVLGVTMAKRLCVCGAGIVCYLLILLTNIRVPKCPIRHDAPSRAPSPAQALGWFPPVLRLVSGHSAHRSPYTPEK